MRWIGFVAVLTACGTAWCPQVVDPFDPITTCSTEHELCGREAACVNGLDCVPIVVCTVGPCPGTCLSPCTDDADCAENETCESPAGVEEPYCIEG